MIDHTRARTTVRTELMSIEPLDAMEREYLADAGSVELTKNPDPMISALRKIGANPTIPAMPSRMQAFFIESPALLPESGWLATHPSIEKRIEALVEFAGGRDEPEPVAVEAQETPPPSFLPPGVGPNPPPPGPWG